MNYELYTLKDLAFSVKNDIHEMGLLEYIALRGVNGRNFVDGHRK